MVTDSDGLNKRGSAGRAADRSQRRKIGFTPLVMQEEGPFRSNMLRIMYIFFLLHMALFGISGFVLAYFVSGVDSSLLYIHGGVAISVYLIFYLYIFGVDAVTWMFINAGLGIFALYSQIGWILGLFGKNIGDFPITVHVIPFLYFILYIFLIRQIFIDFSGARKYPGRLPTANVSYVVASIVVSIGGILLSSQL